MRIGKFEWKIVVALLVTAAAPLVFTGFMVERLIEESMAVGLNDQVLSSLRSGVDLYAEVIESRMTIVRLHGRALSERPSFKEALKTSNKKAVETALEDLVASVLWISKAQVIQQGQPWITVDNPAEFEHRLWKSKSDSWEVDQKHKLEVTYVISKMFLNESEELRNLVGIFENLEQNFHPWKMAYYRLFLFIYIWILLAAVILGFLLARSVTTKVATLVNATKQAAAGDLNVRVRINSQDEIGSLAESFNLMMDDIQRGRDRIVYLEKVSSWQEIARRLAHEIKNPLTPIQLAIQELHRSYRGNDKVFSHKLDDSLEIVEEEVETLRRMVQTFSEFAKLPAVQSIPTDLTTFVSDYLKHNPQYSDRVNLHTQETNTPVLLDRLLMGRVLANLIDNGLEASFDNASVDLKVYNQNEWGVLEVADRGEGLDQESRERLFQPYFTTKAEGTGLGLAIVKKIVLQHGGEISVSDRAGGGTKFVVRLRLTTPTTTLAIDGGT